MDGPHLLRGGASAPVAVFETASMSPADASDADRTHRPLGLPPGSVRAVLALTVVGLVIQQALVGAPISLLLSETLLIVLAHYFASRRLVDLPEALRRRLEQDGVLEAEPSPLWLPKHSVRIIILLAFCSTALVLLWQGRLFQPGAFGTIGLFFAYLAGISVRGLVRWRRKNVAPSRRRSVWAHLKAAAVLAACAAVTALTLSGELATLPGWVEKLLLSLILFYFGSR